MKLNIVNIGLTLGGLYVAYKLFSTKDTDDKKKPVNPANEPQKPSDGDYSNFLGIFNKKPSMGQRANQTRCETNLERIGRLFPNTDQYNAELGKAYQQQGSNFNTWASSTAKPCFVVGMEQGGLQSGSANFSGGFY